MAGCSLWVVVGWVVAANHGVGGYNTPTRKAWGLLNGICAGNMILLGEKRFEPCICRFEP